MMKHQSHSMYTAHKERVKCACNSQGYFLKRIESEKDHQQVAVESRKGSQPSFRTDLDDVLTNDPRQIILRSTIAEKRAYLDTLNSTRLGNSERCIAYNSDRLKSLCEINFLPRKNVESTLYIAKNSI